MESAMIHFPVLRWGKPYKSLEVSPVVHFSTGETLAEVSQANGALVQRDMRQAHRARQLLTQIPVDQLLDLCKKAADLFLKSELPAGEGGSQSPEDFYKQQSATTGLPEHMCKFNMEKLHYVLTNLDGILRSMTRGLDYNILTRGFGEEAGVMRSYQACTPVLGMVLPSNSPGVHGLWLPVIPMQIGLVLKPGPQEPWTPYRMAEAFFKAGIPREVISIYPGAHEVGAAVIQHCPRVMMFGSTQTIEQYKGNPRVQVHGPGFSKILLGDDEVDHWPKYVDLMAKSIAINSGRGCINCSGVWASRHTEEIADAIARKIGPIAPASPTDPAAELAAFTIPAQAEGVDKLIESGLQEPGAVDVAAKYRNGPRLVRQERCAYLRPTLIHCDSPDHKLANTEYMFPFASVVRCPQEQMLEKIGPTLVASAITHNKDWQRQLIDATHIDRLNLGPIPTVQLNWFQPHEGNIVDFLFRNRAFQSAMALA
jgi:acyl-CoA reductase-like NAD-dependent aldehyde dehydrogenase